MIYSILDNGNKCINTTLWDGTSDWRPPTGHIAVAQSLEIGQSYFYNEATEQWEKISRQKLPSEAELLEQCDYYAFWDALLISDVYQAIRTQASQSLVVNTCCTEFIAAISDAKAGRANKNAIQACVWLLMNALVLTDAEKQDLQGVLEAGSLDKIYSLSPS